MLVSVSEKGNYRILPHKINICGSETGMQRAAFTRNIRESGLKRVWFDLTEDW